MNILLIAFIDLFFVLHKSTFILKILNTIPQCCGILHEIIYLFCLLQNLCKKSGLDTPEKSRENPKNKKHK